jgi:hypothetical protein
MYGCEDHIFVLNIAINANVSRNRKLYALFIDLSKAFDSVRHQKLWSKLQEARISKKFLFNVQQLYANVKAKIRTKSGEFFPINNSVFQGETLSPKLFSLLVEDIICLSTWTRPGPTLRVKRSRSLMLNSWFFRNGSEEVTRKDAYNQHQCSRVEGLLPGPHDGP